MTASGRGLTSRGAFLVAVLVYIAYNVIVSVVGLLAKMPDLPATHASTSDITVGDVLLSNGTIMSPPLVTMVIAGILLLGSMARRPGLALACTSLLVLGVAFTTVDEALGFGDRPSLYSSAKWTLAVCLGVAFVVIGVAVVVSGIAWIRALIGVMSAKSEPQRTAP